MTAAPAMHFQPDTSDLGERPHLRLGPAPSGCVTPTLALGNEPGIPLPADLWADTAAGIVLKLLRRANARAALAGIDAVTSATFSGGHLLAMWALCQPEAALSRAEALDDAARAVEFGVCRSEQAAQIACFLRSYPDEIGEHDPAALYRALLPDVTRLVDAPRDFDLYWIGEYSDVLQSENLLRSGAVENDEYEDVELTVLQTPLSLHDLTRFTAASMFRLLTVRSENTYVLEYRRESWVRYTSRRPRPRIDLRPLAQRLNLFERADGVWRAEPVTEPAPRLFLDAGADRPSPSRIDRGTVIAETIDYLRASARRSDLHWSPYTAGER